MSTVYCLVVKRSRNAVVFFLLLFIQAADAFFKHPFIATNWFDFLSANETNTFTPTPLLIH